MGNISLPDQTVKTVSSPTIYGPKRRKEVVPSRQRFTTLTQFFSASFEHHSSDSIQKEDDDDGELKKHTADSHIIHKSGNPGYVKGRPILSAQYNLEPSGNENLVKLLNN